METDPNQGCYAVYVSTRTKDEGTYDSAFVLRLLLLT
jgi:hypothetical protein